jgi:RNA polymerase-binding transcription factor DksA
MTGMVDPPAAGVEPSLEEELAAAAAVLDAVEAALERLSSGSYGSCRRCGRPLADDQLAADPVADDCGCTQRGDGGSVGQDQGAE